MGRVLNPSMLMESAEGMNNAGRAYLNSMYEVKPAMEAILNDNEFSGKTATGIKRRAEAHLTLLEHFQITEAMNTLELSKLRSALSNIHGELNEDELRATIEDEKRDIIYFNNQIKWLRKHDREYSFWGLFNYYQYSVDASHNIINKCEKKLRDLDNFDSISQSYFTSVADNYQMQKQAIRDMMQADIKGDYSNVDYSNISAIESRVKTFLDDKNKVNELLFDENKKLRKESVKLFSDTPRDKMNSFQRAMYNRVIEFVLSDDCTADDLTNVVDGYYTEAKSTRIGVSKVQVRFKKETFDEFVYDLEDGLYNLTLAGKSNNNMVSRVALFSEISKVQNIHNVGNVSVDTNSMNVSTYTLPISLYKTESTIKYDNARIINTERAYIEHTSLVVRTDGHGVNGAHYYQANILKKQIENNNDIKKFLSEVGMNVIEDISQISVPILPTLIEAMQFKNQKDESIRILDNIYQTEFAILTDSYVTSINDDIVLRNGPNTQKISSYMRNNGYNINDDKSIHIKNFKNYANNNKIYTSVNLIENIKNDLITGGYIWKN